MTILVSDLLTHPITRLANQRWASNAGVEFDLRLVESIYNDYIHGADDPTAISILEISSYLENYLWRFFVCERLTSRTVILSVMALVNQKSKHNVPIWSCFDSEPEAFTTLLKACFSLSFQDLSDLERTTFITFMISIYQSLENIHVRNVALQFASLPLWTRLPKRMLQRILCEYPDLKKGYEKLKFDGHHPEANLLWDLTNDALRILRTDDEVDDVYFSRFFEFIIDLISLVSTRRFVRPLLLASHFLESARLSNALSNSPLCMQMLDLLEYYLFFEIDDCSGVALTDEAVERQRYDRMQILQHIVFKHFRSTGLSLALAAVCSMDTPDSFISAIKSWSDSDLISLASRIELIHQDWEPDRNIGRELVEQILIHYACKKRSRRQEISALPLYPTENIVFNTNLTPEDHYQGEASLPLSKLNLQFLSMHDYLLRNFHLYRLESTHQIRQDICMAVSRLEPRLHPETSKTIFIGWSRMAVPVDSVKITQVGRNRVGEEKPSCVLAEIRFNLQPFSGVVRQEWEELKQHDVLFMLNVTAKDYSDIDIAGAKANDSKKSIAFYDINGISSVVKHIRGCEIVSIQDVNGRLIDAQNKEYIGTQRVLTVALDPAQFAIDREAMIRSMDDGEADCLTYSLYTSLNLLVRRKPKENNFKAVLQSVRDMMHQDLDVPDWLKEVFLGYGSPDQASYWNLPNSLDFLDLHDTCLDEKHLRESFPQLDIDLRDSHGPPYRLYIPRNLKIDSSHAHPVTGSSSSASGDVVSVQNGLEQSDDQKSKLKKTEAESSSKTSHSRDDLKKLTVAVLRKMLKRAGKDTSGRKAELIDRLMNGSSENEMEPMTNTDSEAPEPASDTDIAASEPMTDSDAPGVAVERVEFEHRHLAHCVSYQSTSMTYYSPQQRNHIHYTPNQVDAIVSGCQPGLSLIVGPPGTGKTDVAVQIIVNLHHQYPHERILLVTHSNHALNDLFDKLCCRDIDPSLMLRLGQGHKDLKKLRLSADISSLETDFSSRGRTDFMLARRVMLLDQVRILAQTLGVEPMLPSSSCDAAQMFYKNTIQPVIKQFKERESDHVDFPFRQYFSNTAFPDKDKPEYNATADRCFAHLGKMFMQLNECRAFEVLRRGSDRAEYLLMKHARIVAMTCTHASLKRQDFLRHGCRFHTMIMEEAGQVLDIETCIPMFLQKADPEFGCLLKRAVLLGDHCQLPPVVQNQVLQSFSHLDQSLFARFVRLGIPFVELSQQGRTRPAIASLYKWRYPTLKDMPCVMTGEYLLANAGLRYTHQFIDVPDYMNQGETQPTPHFYQNLGEAEYVVQLYIYLRLIGYPASRISVITTYNGQKQLLRDIFNARCRQIGLPQKVATVDRFQGQQNDIILLSLVRTRNIGHVRDVRRLVVALSRARLGLYIFGRRSLFQNCFELTPAMSQLFQIPTRLELVPEDKFPTSRTVDGDVQSSVVIGDVIEMGKFVEGLKFKGGSALI